MSKLNIDQKTISDLFSDKKPISSSPIISDPTRGHEMSARRSGTTLRLSPFRMTRAETLTAKTTSTSSAP